MFILTLVLYTISTNTFAASTTTFTSYEKCLVAKETVTQAYVADTNKPTVGEVLLAKCTKAVKGKE